MCEGFGLTMAEVPDCTGVAELACTALHLEAMNQNALDLVIATGDCFSSAETQATLSCQMWLGGGQQALSDEINGVAIQCGEVCANAGIVPFEVPEDPEEDDE